MQHVLIIGATGFTGRYVLDELSRSGRYDISLFVRDPAKLSFLPTASGRRVHYGTIEDIKALTAALRGVEILVCTASLGFGHAPNLLQACHDASVKRTIFFSTTAIFTRLNPPSKKLRLAAETAIQASGLDYTILRPTMIYGARGDRNIFRLIRYIDRMPIIVIPGRGHNLLQPVFVKDLAMAVRQILAEPSTIGKCYTLSGRDVIPFGDLVRYLASALERRRMYLHIPICLATAPLSVLNACGLRTPIKVEQILRLQEDKTFSFDEAANDFGYAPSSLAEVLQAEVAEYLGDTGRA